MKRAFTGLMISLAIGGSLAAPDANAGDYYAFANIGNADTKFRSNVNDVMTMTTALFRWGLATTLVSTFPRKSPFTTLANQPASLGAHRKYYVSKRLRPSQSK